MGRLEKNWNKEVEDMANSLEPVKEWLNPFIEDPEDEENEFDWASEKSAHAALKYLELAQYEIKSLMYWENKRQVELDRKANNTIA